jgi:L,D-transpeptidase catalytic domain
MRVRASLLPLAAATAVVAVQTASGSPATAPRAAGGGLQPALAAVAVELAEARSVRQRVSRTPPAHKLAVVRGGVALRHRPGGPVRGRLDAITEFGSPRVLGVAKRRGDWLGVVTTARPNNRLAWVRRGSPGLKLRRTRWSLHADLSARTLVLRRAGRRVRRVVVGVGRLGSETPTGRFAVTDKLSGGRFGPYYGCCILALSGHQPKLPPGWTGGNRLAIHGTDAPSTIGAAASAGCLRAADAPLRVLMRQVPLGTPVFIRR